MEGSQGAQPAGSSSDSVFTGQKYNPEQNTVTHYKAGRNAKKKKNKCKTSNCKKKNGQIESAFKQ